MASDQAGVAALNALFRPLKAFKWTGAVVPWVTFTAPEVARVGLSEREAQEKSLAVTVTRVGYDDNDRAIAEGEMAGFIQVLTPPGKDHILGVTIVGARAGSSWRPGCWPEHGLGLKKIMGTIHAYPTYAELNEAVASAWRRPTRRRRPSIFCATGMGCGASLARPRARVHWRQGRSSGELRWRLKWRAGWPLLRGPAAV